MSKRIHVIAAVVIWLAIVVVSAFLADLSYGQPGNPKHPYGSTAGDVQREVEYDNDGDHVGVNLKGLPTPVGTATPAPTARCAIKCVAGQAVLSAGGGNWGALSGGGANGCACAGTGTSSTLVGVGAVASALNSTAVGASASASATRAMALGQSAVANQTDAVVIGQGGAVGGVSDLAIGNSALASGTLTTVIGHGAGLGTSGVDRSVLIGYVAGATTAGDDSVCVGYGCIDTAAQGVSIGSTANVTVAGCTAIGYSADCTSATGGTSVGINALSSAGSAVAVGDNAAATGAAAIGIGNAVQATDDDAVAVGPRAVASVEGGIALGPDASADRADCIAIGRGADCSANSQFKIGSVSHEISEIRPAGSSTNLGSSGFSFASLWVGNVNASVITTGVTGTGKVLCVKSDGTTGKCSDAPNGSGVCTCG